MAGILLVASSVAVGTFPTAFKGYTILSESGKLVFVMLPQQLASINANLELLEAELAAGKLVVDELREKLSHAASDTQVKSLKPKISRQESHNKRIQKSIDSDRRKIEFFGDPEIRKYRHSGLYPVDNPDAPVWTVSWGPSEVAMAGDGKYLVRLAPKQFLLAMTGISFYVDGAEVRSYLISELISRTEGLSGFGEMYTWRKSTAIDREILTYTLTTIEGKVFVFDLRTGEIIR